MCSPGKAPPAKKDVKAKYETPSKSSTRPCTPKTPKSISKARGGLPPNVSDLTVEESFAVAHYLKGIPDDHPNRNKRLTFSDLPEKPKISLSPWAYDDKAPFLLAVRKTGCHYIPKGEKADGFLLNLTIKEIRQKKHKVTNPSLIFDIFDGLNGYAIQGALERVENVFKNATLLNYLDNFAQEDNVQEVVNQIHARFLQVEAANKAIDQKIDAVEVKVDAKLAAVDAKMDATRAKSLLELRCTTLNNALRLHPDNAWALSRADSVDQYLESLPLFTGKCYRGVNAKGVSRPTVLGWNQENSEYTDEGFTTASLLPEVAWKYAGVDPNNRVIFEIQSKMGRVIPSDVGDDKEKEISFKRGTKFLIHTSHTHNFLLPNQYMLVQMEEVEEFDDDL